MRTILLISLSYFVIGCITSNDKDVKNSCYYVHNNSTATAILIGYSGGNMAQRDTISLGNELKVASFDPVNHTDLEFFDLDSVEFYLSDSLFKTHKNSAVTTDRTMLGINYFILTDSNAQESKWTFNLLE